MPPRDSQVSSVDDISDYQEDLMFSLSTARDEARSAVRKA